MEKEKIQIGIRTILRETPGVELAIIKRGFFEKFGHALDEESLKEAYQIIEKEYKLNLN